MKGALERKEDMFKVRGVTMVREMSWEERRTTTEELRKRLNENFTDPLAIVERGQEVIIIILSIPILIKWFVHTKPFMDFSIHLTVSSSHSTHTSQHIHLYCSYSEFFIFGRSKSFQPFESVGINL